MPRIEGLRTGESVTTKLELPRAKQNRNLKPPRKKPVLTMEQAGALISAIKGPKARTMIALAFHTGMRRGELLAMRWQGLDPERPQLHITEAAYEGVLDTPKTGPNRADDSNKRDVDLEAQTLTVLENWRKLSKRTAVHDRLSWNAFRRSWQTWAHNERISQRAIADVVGHANLETQQIYIQPLEEERKKAVTTISGRLHSFCTDPSQMSIPFEHEEGWVN